jgi:CBS domain-containing protein
MIDFKRYILLHSAETREALQLINEIAIPNMAIFIVDEELTLLGSLTDGDIRRGLLNGFTIDEPVSKFMFVTSKFIIEGENSFDKVNQYKAKNIRFIPVLNADRTIIRLLDLENIHAVIPADVVLMAGGKGERLLPLTSSIPKPMLKIGDKPIIIRNIERLASFGL